MKGVVFFIMHLLLMMYRSMCEACRLLASHLSDMRECSRRDEYSNEHILDSVCNGLGLRFKPYGWFSRISSHMNYLIFFVQDRKIL
jgi:hypothetical protein